MENEIINLKNSYFYQNNWYLSYNTKLSYQNTKNTSYFFTKKFLQFPSHSTLILLFCSHEYHINHQKQLFTVAL